MAWIYAFFIALLCTQSVVHAADYASTGEECYSSSPQGAKCGSGLYCQYMAINGGVYKCQDCPPRYANSVAGSVGITSCYTMCDNKPDFQNGIWKPDSTEIYYDNANVETNVCHYTNSNNITCNNPTDPCNGYHLSVEQCVSNIKTCKNGSHTGFSTYSKNQITNQFSWSDCFITTCSKDFHLEETTTMCGQTHGVCISNTQSCKSKLTCDGDDVTINGNAYWKNNAYDYSECTCDRKASLKYGTGTELCTWDGTTWSNCKRTLETCKAGYWKGETPNPTDCTQVYAGYYSADKELTCHVCPAGSTSDAGSTALTDCYMTGNQTIICDSNNKCFLLPEGAGDKIYYHNGN